MQLALSIAGLDPSGGAGILADCNIFSEHKIHPLAIVSALTVQNSLGVSRVVPVSAKLLEAQLEKLLADFPIAAAKTGLLPNRLVIRTVAKLWPSRLPLVVDPVLASSGGFRFLDSSGIEALCKSLLPKAGLVTPNRAEAEKLSRSKIKTERDYARAARTLLNYGAKAVLIKGGDDKGLESIDRFFSLESSREFRLPRVRGESVHGTGCALSASITALLAEGKTLLEAIHTAKQETHIRIAQAQRLGKGRMYL